MDHQGFDFLSFWSFRLHVSGRPAFGLPHWSLARKDKWCVGVVACDSHTSQDLTSLIYMPSSEPPSVLQGHLHITLPGVMETVTLQITVWVLNLGQSGGAQEGLEPGIRKHGGYLVVSWVYFSSPTDEPCFTYPTSRAPQLTDYFHFTQSSHVQRHIRENVIQLMWSTSPVPLTMELKRLGPFKTNLGGWGLLERCDVGWWTRRTDRCFSSSGWEALLSASSCLPLAGVGGPAQAGLLDRVPITTPGPSPSCLEAPWAQHSGTLKPVCSNVGPSFLQRAAVREKDGNFSFRPMTQDIQWKNR